MGRSDIEDVIATILRHHPVRSSANPSPANTFELSSCLPPQPGCCPVNRPSPLALRRTGCRCDDAIAALLIWLVTDGSKYRQGALIKVEVGYFDGQANADPVLGAVDDVGQHSTPLGEVDDS